VVRTTDALTHCAQLWVEYFRLELVYAQKLRARRQVLGIDDSTGAMLASARGNTCASCPCKVGAAKADMSPDIIKTKQQHSSLGILLTWPEC